MALSWPPVRQGRRNHAARRRHRLFDPGHGLYRRRSADAHAHLPRHRRSRPLRRRRRRQAGEADHRPQGRRLRGARERQAAVAEIFFRRGSRRGAAAAHRAAARHQRQHGGRHQGLAHRRRSSSSTRSTTPPTSRWSTSTPKSASRGSAPTTTRAWSSGSADAIADGWTALYDAIGVYLNGAQNQDGQKVLVLYTDGGDTTQLPDLPRHARPVQGVGRHRLRGRLPGAPGQRPDAAARANWSAWPRLTGGQAYFPGVAKDLDGVFEKIQQELAARYSLGYLSTDPRTDGAWRGVEIKLVRARSERRQTPHPHRLLRSL